MKYCCDRTDRENTCKSRNVIKVLNIFYDDLIDFLEVSSQIKYLFYNKNIKINIHCNRKLGIYILNQL